MLAGITVFEAVHPCVICSHVRLTFGLRCVDVSVLMSLPAAYVLTERAHAVCRFYEIAC